MRLLTSSLGREFFFNKGYMVYLVSILAARLNIRFANVGYFIGFATMRGTWTDACVALMHHSQRIPLHS
jgi:hypothetical protein